MILSEKGWRGCFFNMRINSISKWFQSFCFKSLWKSVDSIHWNNVTLHYSISSNTISSVRDSMAYGMDEDRTLHRFLRRKIILVRSSFSATLSIHVKRIWAFRSRFVAIIMICFRMHFHFFENWIALMAKKRSHFVYLRSSIFVENHLFVDVCVCVCLCTKWIDSIDAFATNINSPRLRFTCLTPNQSAKEWEYSALNFSINNKTWFFLLLKWIKSGDFRMGNSMQKWKSERKRVGTA